MSQSYVILEQEILDLNRSITQGITLEYPLHLNLSIRDRRRFDIRIRIGYRLIRLLELRIMAGIWVNMIKCFVMILVV